MGKGRTIAKAATGAAALMVCAILARSVLLGIPALCDNTESRYAMISLEMAGSGDWVTPRIWYNGVFQPFWGKPPMHFWLTAASLRLFGHNEAASRLPGFLGGIAILLSVFFLARRAWGRATAWTSVAVLASTVLFMGLSGSCTTDITLASFLSVAMAAFALHTLTPPGWSRRLWGLLFFVALAGGVLAKGPVALVLAGLALFSWAAVTGRWKYIQSLPWLLGVPVFLALAVPWFVAAERATPGFLRYYFVSEHFLRYVSHNYGDLYGGGHARPYGTIWALLLASFFPWIFLWWRPVRDFISSKSVRQAVRRDEWLVYALAWGLAPAVFFTFARQVLPTYLAPGMAGLAIATAVGLVRRDKDQALLPGWIVVSALLAGLIAGGPFLSEKYSAREILRAVSSDPRLAVRRPAFPAGEPYSGDFYALKFLGRGMLHDPAIPGEGRVRTAIDKRSADILLIPRRKFIRLPAPLIARLTVAAQTPSWVACLVKGER